MEDWIVYILRCSDGTLYTGITNDFDKRMAKHKAGTGAKYTRGRGPFKIVGTREFRTKSAALKLEIAIKKLPRTEKLKALKSF